MKPVAHDSAQAEDASALDLLDQGGEFKEHFIPIRRAALVEELCSELDSPEQIHLFRQWCRLIEATFHYDFQQEMRTLKNAYAPFDPDADTQLQPVLTREEKEQRLDILVDRCKWLMRRANFKQLSADDIHEALQGASAWGLDLDVDFTVFDRLEIFARGETTVQRKLRRLTTLFREKEVTVPVFQRLLVLLRLRRHKRLPKYVDTEHVYIKFFKDIPRMDLEMLLPGTRPRMRMLDRVKIGVPTVAGLGLTFGKFGLSGMLALLASPLHNTLAFLTLAGGTVGYGIRSFYGYLQTKQRYQLTLTESLYFQNLDNNLGVLCRLVDEAEEQECREAFLAYFHLWRYAGQEGWTLQRLDEAVESYLLRRIGRRIDFEVNDALQKLIRLSIVRPLPGHRYRALGIKAALKELDRAWDNIFPYHDGDDSAD